MKIVPMPTIHCDHQRRWIFGYSGSQMMGCSVQVAVDHSYGSEGDRFILSAWKDGEEFHIRPDEDHAYQWDMVCANEDVPEKLERWLHENLSYSMVRLSDLNIYAEDGSFLTSPMDCLEDAKRRWTALCLIVHPHVTM